MNVSYHFNIKLIFKNTNNLILLNITLLFHNYGVKPKYYIFKAIFFRQNVNILVIDHNMKIIFSFTIDL